MCHRKPTKEQLHVSDPLDPKYLDCRVFLACFYEALSYHSGIYWSKVMPDPQDLHLLSLCHLWMLWTQVKGIGLFMCYGTSACCCMNVCINKGQLQLPRP